MKTIQGFVIAALILCLSACNLGGGDGGTETGTSSPVNASRLAARIETAASAMVPSIQAAEGDSEGLSALELGSSDQWAIYIDPMNVTMLTDIFAPNDESEDNPVTRIRVLLDSFQRDLEGLFTQDSDFSCEGGERLAEGDSVDLPFLGAISNGTVEDRFLDCLYRYEADEETTYLTMYGIDDQEVVRIVRIQDSPYENERDVETRGTQTRILSVVLATYAETEGEESTVVHLDLQYAQATIYSGADGDLEAADDNVLFKSRSRITGRATLDESGEATEGVGDFTVTKYDRTINDDGDTWVGVTKTHGRGDYRPEGYSLFTIDTTASSVEQDAGTFCLQQPAEGTGLPAWTEAANCEGLETAFAWDDESFPFPLVPELAETYEENALFEEEDLISNTADNFSIPEYESTPVQESDEEEAGDNHEGDGTEEGQ